MTPFFFFFLLYHNFENIAPGSLELCDVNSWVPSEDITPPPGSFFTPPPELNPFWLKLKGNMTYRCVS